MLDLRMPDINSVVIAGNLTRDPSFRKTTNGTPVANFWIASNRKFKDNTGQWRENVCYVGVVAWYRLAESCADNLAKGSAVLVEGELQSRSLRTEEGRNRNIVEIKARRIQFLNKHDETTVVADEEGDHSYTEPDFEMKSSESHPVNDAPDMKHDPDFKTQNPLRGKFDFGYEELEL